MEAAESGSSPDEGGPLGSFPMARGRVQAMMKVKVVRKPATKEPDLR